MSEPKFISKELDQKEGLDYSFLKKKGLEHIQELAGENWTDFNQHDPGVTILEQLAYALTELGYRSNLDFKDLLASQKVKPEKDTFYTVSEILPTNPITTTDFRKIVIDRVEGIQNIWILPLNSFTKRRNLKGLYIAFIDVDTTHPDGVDAIRKKTLDLLNHYSNLGEAFEDVYVLKEQEIYVQCEIDLEKNANVERVHSKILFEIEKLITRPLMFYSLNEMLERGHSVNDIFDGPRLLNGFIENDTLLAKDSVFFNSQILNKIRDVEGIKNIKSFNLVVESENRQGVKVYNDYVDILSNKVVNELVAIKWSGVAVLGEKIYTNVNNPTFFKYTNDGIPIQLKQKEVTRILKNLKAKIKVRSSRNKDQEIDFPIPQGVEKPISHYYSIQHQFPNLYGLKKNGYSSKTTPERKAQIFQLKGYLLFFEQVLSNYLEQLSRFNELYGFDKNLDRSYFVQIPWDIPGIYELIGHVDPNLERSEFESRFQLAVEGIMSGIDNFYERRTKFIKHLLARFGDYSYQNTVDRFNYYHSSEENKKLTLEQSIDLLENFHWLSCKKSRSFDHTSIFWEEDKAEFNTMGLVQREKLKTEDISAYPNMSTLEARIRIMIGLDREVTKIGSNLEPMVKFGEGKPLNSLNTILNHYQETKLVYTKRFVETLWVKEASYKNELEEALIEDIKINEDLFINGVSDDNFSITQSPENDNYFILFRQQGDTGNQDKKRFIQVAKNVVEKLNDYFETIPLEEEHIKTVIYAKEKPVYFVEFERDVNGKIIKTPSEIWLVLHVVEDEELAFRTAFTLKNHLVRLNKKSEGFYIVDHILFRPRSPETAMNILLNDPNSDWSFRLTEGYSIDEIEDGVRADIQDIRENAYQLVNKNGRFVIKWKKGNRVIGRCTQKFRSEAEAHSAAEELKIYFANFSDLDIHDSNRVKFKREITNEPHPLNHYSFTLTVFFSNWTARFSDPEFQYYLESLIRQNTPAHIAIQFKWLDLKDMVTFENLYALWLAENRKAEMDFQFLNGLSSQIISFAKVI